MPLTKSKLKQIIKEEIQQLLFELPPLKLTDLPTTPATWVSKPSNVEVFKAYYNNLMFPSETKSTTYVPSAAEFKKRLMWMIDPTKSKVISDRELEELSKFENEISNDLASARQYLRRWARKKSMKCSPTQTGGEECEQLKSTIYYGEKAMEILNKIYAAQGATNIEDADPAKVAKYLRQQAPPAAAPSEPKLDFKITMGMRCSGGQPLPPAKCRKGRKTKDSVQVQGYDYCPKGWREIPVGCPKGETVEAIWQLPDYVKKVYDKHSGKWYLHNEKTGRYFNMPKGHSAN